MAFIKIIGRADPLVVDDKLARQIKERKFGTDKVVKAEPGELIEIAHGGGEWAGEYHRIKEIDIGRASENKVSFDEERRKENEHMERLLARPAHVKGQELSYYKLCYSVRCGDYKWEPSQELAAQVIAFQTEYFEAHPRDFTIPSKLYGDLLPPKRGVKSLAQKFRVQHDDDITYPSA